MATVKKLDWGKSHITFDGLKSVGGKRIHSEGLNIVNPHQMIPLHQHIDDAEEYTTLSTGLKIIVIPAENLENLNDEEVLNMLKKQKRLLVGERVVCPKGYAHALYNASSTIGRFNFCKYYN